MKRQAQLVKDLQVKTVQKTKKGELKVTFAQSYDEIPVVILTPYWQGSGSPVGAVPTVSEITKKGCTITSGNAAANYFVNVLSVPAGQSKLAGGMVQANSILKTGDMVEAFFNPRFESNDPVILLSSFWQGTNSSVGSIDTLDDSAASEAKIVSSNRASNYYSNYIAMDAGTAYDDDQVVEANIVNKTAKGTHRVYFSTRFEAPPVVMLSPWWNDANSAVGSIETLSKVTTEYFEFTSENAAANYFVNWIAVGE